MPKVLDNSQRHRYAVLFQWIASLIAAAPWLLPVMRATPVGGAYATAALALWSLLRYPPHRRYVLFVMLACAVTTLQRSLRIAAFLGAGRCLRDLETGSLPLEGGLPASTLQLPRVSVESARIELVVRSSAE